MLGLLLARQGIEVVVLEKHADFFRDFRGDTVHPSTLNLIDALGLRAAFDAIPHTPLPRLDAVINGVRLHAVEFGTLPPPNRFVTLMPQWDLLELLAAEGARHPSFHLHLSSTVVGVIERAGRIEGVRVADGDGVREIEADLVVAADGRDSAVRAAAGLVPRSFELSTDVTWFRVPRPEIPMPDTLLWASEAGYVFTIPRPDYYQCGLLIPKGSFDDIRREGIEAFRARVARAVPRLAGKVAEIASLDDVKLLSVQLDRLPTWWRPGVLCIGDAAHAMSPVFGVGINYAVQDAVAAARLLVPALRSGGGTGATTGLSDGFSADSAASAALCAAVDRACAAVERRRARPTAMMQTMQRVAHRMILSGGLARVLDNPPTRRQRLVLRLLLPALRPLIARIVGYGFLPERL